MLKTLRNMLDSRKEAGMCCNRGRRTREGPRPGEETHGKHGNNIAVRVEEDGLEVGPGALPGHQHHRVGLVNLVRSDKCRN